MKRWAWMMAWVLGVALVAVAGCSDDEEEDSGTTTTVVTNVVNGTVVTNVVTTPNPPTGNGTPNGDNADGQTPAVLTAPMLFSPADGAVIQGGVVDAGVYVEFMWSSVEGAEDYVVDIDGTQHVYEGGTFGIELNWGNYTWSVTAVGANPATDRATSSSRSFSIVPTVAAPLL